MKRDNADSVQSLADEYFLRIKGSHDLGLLKEALEKAQSAALRNLASASAALRNLASAMRKVLPPEVVQEIVDRADPLGAFLRELKK